MSQHPQTGDIYVITYHALFKITYSNRRLNLVTGSSTKGLVNSVFKQARFSYPSEIARISDHMLIVAGERQLRTIDERNQQVGQIGTGELGHKDRGLSKCKLKYPNSLLAYGDTLYIGEEKYIIMIKGLFQGRL